MSGQGNVVTWIQSLCFHLIPSTPLSVGQTANCSVELYRSCAWRRERFPLIPQQWGGSFLVHSTEILEALSPKKVLAL